MSKTFKAKAGDVTAVDGVSFEARKGEVTVIVGPSGSGKTTLLYLIGSLESPDDGEIKSFGEDISAPVPTSSTTGEDGWVSSSSSST